MIWIRKGLGEADPTAPRTWECVWCLDVFGFGAGQSLGYDSSIILGG